jgi:putative cardiolipin synthase
VINNKNQSGFYLLSDNTDAFVARFALATVAEKTLDIQYYIMHNDASGQYLAYAILTAADRGVHVRILVDDINLTGSDSRLKMLSQHANIEIRIFNPLANRDWFRNIELVINLNRAGRRMHNKVFMADNSAAIIGGRNIGDEYFDARHNLNFVDLDLLTIGPIVNEISTSFDDYWNSHWATPIETLSRTKVVKQQLTKIRNKLKDKWHHAKNLHYFESLKQSALTQKIINGKIDFIWADARLFYDSPDKLCQDTTQKTIHFGPRILPYFEQATSELLIASPYFVPGIFGTQWFIKKQNQGLKLKILTNSLAATDVIAVHAGYRKYRKQLLDAGIHLFELKPTAKPFIKRTEKLIEGSSNASLHAKYMVVDQRYVFVGSANLDPRSGNLNTEIGVMVDSKELAKQAGELFNKTISSKNSYRMSLDESGKKISWRAQENGKEVCYTDEPEAGVFRKLSVFILSLLPIESLL